MGRYIYSLPIKRYLEKGKEIGRSRGRETSSLFLSLSPLNSPPPPPSMLLPLQPVPDVKTKGTALRDVTRKKKQRGESGGTLEGSLLCPSSSLFFLALLLRAALYYPNAWMKRLIPLKLSSPWPRRKV